MGRRYLINLVGQKLGKVTITERVADHESYLGYKMPQFKGICECGRSVIKTSRQFRRVKENNACNVCVPFYNRI